MHRQHPFQAHAADILTARDDDILFAVEDLDLAGRVPDGKVTAVEDAAAEEDGGRGRVFVVALRADVAGEDNFAGFEAGAGDVDGGAVVGGVGGFNHSYKFGGVVTVAWRG